MLVTIVGGFAVGFTANWKLTLVCMCCVPILIFLGYFRMRMLTYFAEKSRLSHEHSAQLACEVPYIQEQTD